MPRETWRTAVLIAIPELAAYTDRWRTVSYAEDHPGISIADRIPPHITVLVPWVRDPADPEVLARLAAAVEGVGPLEIAFPVAGAFPGGTVFLRPEPFDVLTELIRAVAAAFPDHPPYGGEYPDPHPHLTVSAAGGAPVLAEVEAAVAAETPPTVRVDELTIWVAADGDAWRQTGRVAL